MARPEERKILENIANYWEKLAALRERDLFNSDDSGRICANKSTRPDKKGVQLTIPDYYVGMVC
jgi:hypothetical protein